MNNITFEKATLKDIDPLLHIIHRCVKEVNSKDYELGETEEQLRFFNKDLLSDIITTIHFYTVTYNEEIIGMGGVSRDPSQERQSYFSVIFINPDYHKLGIGRKLIEFLEQDSWCLDSDLIEIPASKTGHKFYNKLGYKYHTNPPVFMEDGATIMYKRRS